MVGEEEEKRRWWWFESHHKTTTTTSSKHSQWLHSTLAELDSKTNAMLSLIEEGNADSFAQRAETYYKKRPELIAFVHDFYRAHRSLAHRFHHLKSSPIDHSLSELLDDPHSEIEDPDEDDVEAASSTSKKLEQERLKLIQENDALKRQLLEKDEEKREVIRQLSLTVETLKDENLSLKRRLLPSVSLKKLSFFHLDYTFLGKLFYNGNAPSW
ncbi:hypothetical protein Bca4012_028300 [Brassica carinata]|uniref:BnaC04g00030D protein n=4 Tax=Brassica TaxID=3705 RepID=A0A078ISU0_BRANA|nr:PREDICTED: protein NETWORKED 3C [Brassica oleracea var. oleracea]XP_013690402.1 protein NETWORKED 3C-like [Brassica napus]KAG2290401.1 hypothetical protein Bca52824_050005 [Brassica carinata]KAH0881808.1 hypothetical protein HID58_057904 [Brassica napus]CAF1797215.1 unnamed protein product [Brassica napus]CDY53027.1 BnaC04g00030D [Brassica napus]